MKTTKPILICLAMIGFGTVTAFSLFRANQFFLHFSDVASLAITAATMMAILGLVVEGDDIVVDISRPLGLFGLFYLFYYVIPIWVAVVTDAPARHNALEMSTLTAVAYACVALGITLSGYRRIGVAKLSRGQVRALLTLCIAAVPLLAWYYAWRVSIGSFYLHGGDYFQEETVLAGLMENAFRPLQLPVILILGLVLRSVEGKSYTWVKRFLLSYTAASVLVYAASSQFRPLATSFLFCIASLNISQRRPVKMKAYLGVGAVSALMLFIIIAVRAIAVNWTANDNQLSDSISSSQSALSGNVDDTDMQKTTFTRMLNQQNLLSGIMDEIRQGHPYLYGELLFTSAYSVVPRVFWPDKPTVTPMQVLIRLDFDMTAQDDSVGPLLEFYANYGWTADIFGFLLLGLLIGRCTKAALVKHTLLSTLVICWMWSVFANLEQEIVLALVTGFRLILIVAAIAWMLRTRLFSIPLKALAGVLLSPIWMFFPNLIKRAPGRAELEASVD